GGSCVFRAWVPGVSGEADTGLRRGCHMTQAVIAHYPCTADIREGDMADAGHSHVSRMPPMCFTFSSSTVHACFSRGSHVVQLGHMWFSHGSHGRDVTQGWLTHCSEVADIRLRRGGHVTQA
ncbi:33907_t:CDS:2, partial [Gigaspora margarita]